MKITEQKAAALPEPLRKRKPDQQLYSRPPEIETLITTLLTLSTEELVERARVEDPQEPDFVPPECLLYFLRRSQGSSELDKFRELFRLLRQRVVRATPVVERRVSGSPKAAVKVIDVNIQEAVLDAFNEMLCNDRVGYDDRLDYFEIRFNSAVSRLRLTARKKVMRVGARQEPLVSDASDTNAPSAEVEEALSKLRDRTADASSDFLYRLKLLAEINSLPVDEKRVVELLLQDLPIDSSDPATLTVVKVLGCSEKTVRNRRDRAYAKLRAALQGGTEDE